MEAIAACEICGLVQRLPVTGAGAPVACSRCGAIIARRRVGSLRRTAAFTLAALILYVPANIFPILSMELYGATSDSTIWDGCARLLRDGEWLVAGIIFFASILVPLFKLLGLSFLIATTRTKSPAQRQTRARIHRVIRSIGPWAMLDVFLLSVLVALVRLEKIATILPGPGLLAFTLLVVFTILASASFDPRLIWNERDGAS